MVGSVIYLCSTDHYADAFPTILENNITIIILQFKYNIIITLQYGPRR